jgi:hypothetical protein
VLEMLSHLFLQECRRLSRGSPYIGALDALGFVGGVAGAFEAARACRNVRGGCAGGRRWIRSRRDQAVSDPRPPTFSSSSRGCAPMTFVLSHTTRRVVTTGMRVRRSTGKNCAEGSRSATASTCLRDYHAMEETRPRQATRTEVNCLSHAGGRRLLRESDVGGAELSRRDFRRYSVRATSVREADVTTESPSAPHDDTGPLLADRR